MFDYDAPDNLLSKRTILVTGAGDGIGRAASTTFAKYGATVILLGRTQSKLESVYDEIESEGYPQAAIHPLDLESAQEEEYQNLGSAIVEEFGQLDGLLHNAGVLGQRVPLQNYSLEAWNQVMKVNLEAAFCLTKFLLPAMQISEDASIVFTSSGVGKKGRAYWGAYAVSKFATEGLMQTLADELKETSAVRVNSLNPGGCATDMRKKAFPAENPDTLPSPQELMNVYLYLMGVDSKGVSGQAFDAQ